MVRQLHAAALVVLILYSTASGAAESGSLPPPEAFGALPFVEQPSLSPDGKHFARIQPLDNRRAVLIATLGAPKGTLPNAVTDSDGQIDAINWASNDRLLITTNLNTKAKDDRTLRSWYRTISVDVDGNNSALMFSDAQWRRGNTSASTIVDLDLDDPQHVFMALLAPSLTGSRLQLFRVDVVTGKAELVKDGSMTTHEWILDGHGRLAARLSWSNYPLTDHVEVPDGQNWREIGHYDALGLNDAGVEGVADDGVGIIRLPRNMGSGYSGLVRLDPATGKESAVFSSEPFDLDRALRDPWTRRVIGASHADDLERYTYLDPKMEGLQQGLEAAFPGTSVHAVSWDTAKDKLIVAVEGPRQPLAYYFLDRTTHAASKIASTYPSLNEADLGERKPYSYAARDGLNIPAYLTLPPNKAPKNLPAIILPHGGPVARDTGAFDWMAAFFASRGYAVLQPNFRGSSGYGAKFEEAGFGQWGRKMQDDLSDGVKKLVADGIADPKRICIAGASYGGYAALAGAAFTPDLYACAVSLAGVSDLQLFVGDKGLGEAWAGSAWSKYMGDDWSREKAAATSPAQHADLVKCPILLLHGEVDTTVPIRQSEVMRDALQKAGKSVEFVKLDSDSHYLQLADTRIRFLKETEAFLKKNIGN